MDDGEYFWWQGHVFLWVVGHQFLHAKKFTMSLHAYEDTRQWNHDLLDSPI